MGILGFTRSLARGLVEAHPRERRFAGLDDDGATTAPTRDAGREAAHPALAMRAGPGAPEEIAEVILFLASEASRAITGQEILVDRGWAHS